MGTFISRQKDWNMVELLGLEIKLCKVNHGRWPYITLYLYGDPAYYTIYNIIGFFKNYSNQLRIATHNRFNKIMAKLCIEINHGFALYQNL